MFLAQAVDFICPQNLTSLRIVLPSVSSTATIVTKNVVKTVPAFIDLCQSCDASVAMTFGEDKEPIRGRLEGSSNK
jgi:hypothetical protein